MSQISVLIIAKVNKGKTMGFFNFQKTEDGNVSSTKYDIYVSPDKSSVDAMDIGKINITSDGSYSVMPGENVWVSFNVSIPPFTILPAEVRHVIICKNKLYYCINCYQWKVINSSFLEVLVIFEFVA